jgi:hypothetical protein
LGIVLARNQERFRNFIQKWKLLLFFATIIFAIYIFFEGLNGYLKTHDYLTFYSSWRPSILLYTICLSGFLYWVFNRRLKAIETIKKISHLSFFVFFIHHSGSGLVYCRVETCTDNQRTNYLPSLV